MQNKFYIIILFLAISLLSFLGYQRMKDFSENTEKISLPEIKIDEFNLDNYLPQETTSYSEWKSPDGLIKMQYPSSWIDSTNVLEMSPNEKNVNLQNFETIFFAQRASIQDQIFAFLTVVQSRDKKSLDDAINEMQQFYGEQEEKIEINILEKKDNEAYLEIILKDTETPTFYSRAKVLFLKEKTYIIIFTIPQKDWNLIENEIEKIFNSVLF